MRPRKSAQFPNRGEDRGRAAPGRQLTWLHSMLAQNFGRDENLAARAVPRQGPQQPGDPIGDPRMAGDAKTGNSFLPIEDQCDEPEKICGGRIRVGFSASTDSIGSS